MIFVPLSTPNADIGTSSGFYWQQCSCGAETHNALHFPAMSRWLLPLFPLLCSPGLLLPEAGQVQAGRNAVQRNPHPRSREGVWLRRRYDTTILDTRDTSAHPWCPAALCREFRTTWTIRPRCVSDCLTPVPVSLTSLTVCLPLRRWEQTDMDARWGERGAEQGQWSRATAIAHLFFGFIKNNFGCKNLFGRGWASGHRVAVSQKPLIQIM